MRVFGLAALCLIAVTALACYAEPHIRAEPRLIEPASASDDAIHILADEFSYETSANRVKPGVTDFVVVNSGDYEHEFVIVPLQDGRFGLPIGEIEAFQPGETRAMRADLAPGSYALVCLLLRGSGLSNHELTELSEDERVTPHMALGMTVPFEVDN